MLISSMRVIPVRRDRKKFFLLREGKSMAGNLRENHSYDKIHTPKNKTRI